MIDAFEFYRLYLSVKLHFDPSSTYDMLAAKGPRNVNREVFEKRSDRKFYEVLSGRHKVTAEAVHFLVANAVQKSGRIHAVDLLDPEAVAVANRSRGRLDSLYRNLELDTARLRRLYPDETKWYKIGDEMYPRLACEAMSHSITPETYTLLVHWHCPDIGAGVEDPTGFWKRWNYVHKVYYPLLDRMKTDR